MIMTAPSFSSSLSSSHHQDHHPHQASSPFSSSSHHHHPTSCGTAASVTSSSSSQSDLEEESSESSSSASPFASESYPSPLPPALAATDSTATTMVPTTTTTLRHDEQESEDHYDQRTQVLVVEADHHQHNDDQDDDDEGVIGATTTATAAALDDVDEEVEAEFVVEQQQDEKIAAKNNVGKIRFSKRKLYGREKELQQLQELYNEMVKDDSTTPNDAGGSADADANADADAGVATTTTPTPQAATSAPAVAAQIIFLPGYSGTGKTSLVQEFYKRITTTTTTSTTVTSSTILTSKFEKNVQSTTSYSGITEVLNQYFGTILKQLQQLLREEEQKQKQDDEKMERIHTQLQNIVGAIGDYGTTLLKEMIPNLTLFLNHYDQKREESSNCYDDALTVLQSSSSHSGVNGGAVDGLGCSSVHTTCSEKTTSTSNYHPRTTNSTTSAPAPATATAKVSSLSSSSHHLDPKMKHQILPHVLRSLLKNICCGGGTGGSGSGSANTNTNTNPFVWFLDDLQWMDEGSLTVLTSFLSDPQLQNCFFIGAYRSNEVQDVNDTLQQEQTDDSDYEDDSSNNDHQNYTNDLTNEEKNNNNDDDDDEDNTEHTDTTTNAELYHPVTVLQKELKRKWCCTTTIELQDLSLTDITEFVADTLYMNDDSTDHHHEKVIPLTKAIYEKTLGNIFFTMQAMEELVRQQGLYYDVMMFQWEYNLSSIEKQQLLNVNIVDMIQSKILQNTNISRIVQHFLIVLAYTKSKVDSSILYPLIMATTTIRSTTTNNMNGGSVCSTTHSMASTNSSGTTASAASRRRKTYRLPSWSGEWDDLVQGLDQAVEEGLLVVSTATTTASSQPSNKEYSFAHDRIREAAHALLPEGPGRHPFLLKLGHALERQSRCTSTSPTGNPSGYDDWMVFTAASHLNSLPIECIENCNVFTTNDIEEDDNEEDGSIIWSSPKKKRGGVGGGRRPRRQHHRRGSKRHATTKKKKNGNDQDDDNTENGMIQEEPLIYLSRLNLRAAKLAIGRSGFRQALELLRSGVACLDQCLDDDQWRFEYDLSLDLHNHLLETEFTLGNHAAAQDAVQQVLVHGKKHRADRLLAQYYDIEIVTCTKDRNYDLGIERSLTYLAGHGVIDINSRTKTPSEVRLAKEKFTLQLLMGRRTLLDLLDLHRMDDYHEQVMRLIAQLIDNCLLGGHVRLALFLNLTAQKLSWERGISKYLPPMLPHYGVLLRQQGKLAEACKVALAAEKMLQRICEGPSWVRGMHVCHAGVTTMCVPYSSSIDVFNEVHGKGIASGDCQWGLLAGMMYCHAFYASGWPINSLFEAKVALFEDESKSFGVSPSLIVTFRIFRQVLLNFQGKGNPNPVLLQGKAIDEDKALAEFEGSTYQQTRRDMSIYKLMLAYVFDDEAAMEEMLDRLSSVPEFDLCVPRQHLRDLFMGLAATRLGRSLKRPIKHQQQLSPPPQQQQSQEKQPLNPNKRNRRNQAKHYLNLGREKQKAFQKLSKVGSANASPALLCLRAEEKPSQINYDKAIEACSSAEMLHLEAMMNESCGLFLLKEQQGNHNNNNNNAPTTEKDNKINNMDYYDEAAVSYLTKAMWLYYDWGAMGKVNAMRTSHSFLRRARRVGRSSLTQMSFIATSTSTFF